LVYAVPVLCVECPWAAAALGWGIPECSVVEGVAVWKKESIISYMGR